MLMPLLSLKLLNQYQSTSKMVRNKAKTTSSRRTLYQDVPFRLRSVDRFFDLADDFAGCLTGDDRRSTEASQSRTCSASASVAASAKCSVSAAAGDAVTPA